MGEYDLGKLKEIGGSGVSGLASRSDAARARELARHGLTMQSYDDLVQQQSGSCFECHRLERVKLANGKRKPLRLGFDKDGKVDRLLCISCTSKIRSAKARDRKENAPKKYLDNEAWWAQQRESLTPAQLEEFRVREERVLDLEIMMTYWLNGFAEDVRTPLSTLLGQVERDVKAHGLIYCPDLNFHEFHDEIDYGDYKETRNYIMYGVQTAIESQLYWDFIHKVKPNPAPRCMTHGCTNPQGKLEPWFCDGCSLERTRRSNAHHRGVTPPGREDRMYSVQGEWRTADTTNAAWFAKLPGA